MPPSRRPRSRCSKKLDATVMIGVWNLGTAVLITRLGSISAPLRMHAVGRRPARALGILPRFRFVSRVASDHRSVAVTHTLAAFRGPADTHFMPTWQR